MNMLNDYINGNTKMLCLIGHPIRHTLSPLIHNTLCKKLNLNYAYVAFDIASENLKDAVNGLRVIGAKGFNVTIPYKNSIMKYLNVISNEAGIMGAINTVKNINGRLIGYNTDGEGFIRSLKDKNISVKGKNIIILGSGGSARSISVKLAMEGVSSIYILNRTISKAQNISTLINKKVSNITKADILSYDRIEYFIKKADILINTTPIGMYPNVKNCIFNDLNFLNSNILVYDLIYNPKKTVFLKEAESKGCQVINGLDMLIFQAVSAFEIWTEKQISKELIYLLQKNINGYVYKNKGL